MTAPSGSRYKRPHVSQGPGREGQGPGREGQGPGREGQGPGREGQGPGREGQAMEGGREGEEESE